jgi:tRNA threonylcarbamoyladenosine biosynthesis protein TsaE
MEFITKNPEETEALAQKVIDAIRTRKGKQGTATIVALSGELGAGKTAFVKGVAKALNLEEVVTSPTFVIEKVYYLENMQPFTHLVHLDCYRLEGGKEMHAVGWNETATDPGNLIFLEWPEKV